MLSESEVNAYHLGAVCSENGHLLLNRSVTSLKLFCLVNKTGHLKIERFVSLKLNFFTARNNAKGSQNAQHFLFNTVN